MRDCKARELNRRECFSYLEPGRRGAPRLSLTSQRRASWLEDKAALRSTAEGHLQVSSARIGVTTRAQVTDFREELLLITREASVPQDYH